jgi:hypothetical protein
LGLQGLIHKNKLKTPMNDLELKTIQKILEVFMDWKNKTDDDLNAASNYSLFGSISLLLTERF